MKSKLLMAFLLANISWATTAATFPIVHSYRSNATGIFSNVYLVELQKGIVVIDASLTVSSAKEIRSLIDEIGKPLYAVLITHGHPDHYNGLTEITRGMTVPVYSTQGVLDVITKFDAAKEKQWKPMFGDEWPAKRTFPNKIVKDNETLQFENVSFTAHDLGQGESHSDSYWLMQNGGDKNVFIGDEVLYRVHAYMSDAHTSEWLDHLNNFKTLLQGVNVIYPGHGLPGGLEMLDWQRQYIEAYIVNLKPLWADKKITDDEKKMLTEKMKLFLNNDKLAFLIGLGAEPVALEMFK
jgi:glyoxylase-like metal-dependent hydrolase (beta-lactamase superfamily II)